jgi:hypothetical protein
MKKKCLYCDSELNQHESYKECLNCRFPVKDSIKDAIEYTNNKFSKQTTFIVIAIFATLILSFYLLGKYEEYQKFIIQYNSIKDFPNISIAISRYESLSFENLALARIIPYSYFIIATISILVIGFIIYVFYNKKKTLERLNTSQK